MVLEAQGDPVDREALMDRVGQGGPVDQEAQEVQAGQGDPADPRQLPSPESLQSVQGNPMGPGDLEVREAQEAQLVLEVQADLVDQKLKDQVQLSYISFRRYAYQLFTVIRLGVFVVLVLFSVFLIFRITSVSDLSRPQH